MADSEQWPQEFAITSETYGSSVRLPSGMVLTLGLASDDPFVNGLTNLTSDEIVFTTSFGDDAVVRLPAAPVSLAMCWAPEARMSTMPMYVDVAEEEDAYDDDDEDDDDADAAEQPRKRHMVTRTRTSVVQVYAPRKPERFVDPLPVLQRAASSGVIVSLDAVAALVALGSPYPAITDATDVDVENDDDVKRRLRRRRLPVYTMHPSGAALIRHAVSL